MSLKIENVIKLFGLLSENEWKTSEQLANEFGVSKRTVLRYIDDLNCAFSPSLSIDSGRHGFRLDKFDFLETIRHHEDVENLAAVFCTPLGGLIKTKKAYPENLIMKIKDIIEVKGTAPDETLRDLMTAMRKGFFVDLVYQAKDKEKKHRGVPIKLFLDFGLLYLAFFDEEYGFMILLNISKIHSFSLSRKMISENKLQEMRDYLQSAWGKMIQHDSKTTLDVRFMVEDEILPYFVKNPLHASQKIIEHGDHHVFSLRIHNPTEFIRWSLRFGFLIKILEPVEVVDGLKDYLLEMNDYYE